MSDEKGLTLDQQFLVKEFMHLRAEADRLYKMGEMTVQDKSRVYFIAAANYYEMGIYWEADELIHEVSPMYFAVGFIADVEECALVRLKMLKNPEKERHEVDPIGMAEFIDTVHILLKHMEERNHTKFKMLKNAYEDAKAAYMDKYSM